MVYLYALAVPSCFLVQVLLTVFTDVLLQVSFPKELPKSSFGDAFFGVVPTVVAQRPFSDPLECCAHR